MLSSERCWLRPGLRIGGAELSLPWHEAEAVVSRHEQARCMDTRGAWGVRSLKADQLRMNWRGTLRVGCQERPISHIDTAGITGRMSCYV